MKESLKILAVEDETAVAQLLALVWCGPTCRVTSACNGAQALEKIAPASRPFDVVITDHQMPQGTGLELARAARASFRGQDRGAFGAFERDERAHL